MKKGTVKFYNHEKCFGFIVPEDGGKDIFFHSSGMEDTVDKDDNVQFNTEDGKKGPIAINIKLV